MNKDWLKLTEANKADKYRMQGRIFVYVFKFTNESDVEQTQGLIYSSKQGFWIKWEQRWLLEVGVKDLVLQG